MTDTMTKTAVGKIEVSREVALWMNYKATGEIRIRNELVLLYTKLVEIIAKKMYHVFSGKAQIDDIISNGMISLIKAVESFDPSRGIQFDTYASIRIRGSVIDYIRDQDWVPRTAREKSKKIEEAYAVLRARFDREPTYIEIAEEIGVTIENVESSLCDAHTYNVLSLEELLVDRMEVSYEVEDTSTLQPQTLLLKKELRNILATAIDSLSEKERLVTTLYYYESLKVKEIAEVMEISPSRVCQIHSMSLIKMKAKIHDYINM